VGSEIGRGRRGVGHHLGSVRLFHDGGWGVDAVASPPRSSTMSGRGSGRADQPWNARPWDGRPPTLKPIADSDASDAAEFTPPRLGYVIIYVNDVPEALRFYGKAFGLPTRFLHESNQYGELETGGTALAFASHALGAANLAVSLPEGYQPVEPAGRPFGLELSLTVADVPLAYQRALTHGGIGVTEPTIKPWGQTVAVVRDPFGLLVEIGTAINE